MARKRIIYQSEALYVGPSGGGTANQLHRVQDIAHTVDVPRTDIMEFDRLAALSREVLEAPTVGLDFSYYLTNGQNESGLGFAVEGWNTEQSVGILSGLQGAETDIQSYYIQTTPEGTDAAGYVFAGNLATSNIIAIGNGGITSYGLSAAVGDIPTASVSVEGANIVFMTGNEAPAHTIQQDGSIGGSSTTITGATTGQLDVMALRPGDISLSFGSAEFDMGGAVLPGMTSTREESNVQSVSFDLPMSRTPLNRIGSQFTYGRTLDTPITASMSVSAQLTDISTGMLSDLICNESEREIAVKFRTRCATTDAANVFVLKLKGANLDSQNMSSSIGDNKTVDLTFSVPVGTDTVKGVFLSGNNGLL